MATNKPTQTLITDTFSQLVDDVNTISLDLGATGRLNTNEDSSAVAAINELEVAVRGTSNNLVATDLASGGLTATNLTAAIVELDSDIGARPHTTLTTTAKTLTGAVNEIDALQGNVSLTTTATTVTGAIVEIDTLQGNSALGTTATTVTGAIAELEAEIDTLNTKVEPAQALTTTATTLSDAINELDAVQGNDALTTTATTLTGAINEHDTEIGSASLNTSATTLRGAINELHTEVGSTVDSSGSGNIVASNVGASLRLLDSAVGNMSDLNTDGSIFNRDTLVKAVNSIADDLVSLDSSSSVIDNRVGSLSLLDSAFTGSERTSAVQAINALRADIVFIFDETGTQLN
jgi:hypothetical protein